MATETADDATTSLTTEDSVNSTESASTEESVEASAEVTEKSTEGTILLSKLRLPIPIR